MQQTWYIIEWLISEPGSGCKNKNIKKKLLEVKSLNLIDKNCISAFYETDKKRGLKKKYREIVERNRSWHITIMNMLDSSCISVVFIGIRTLCSHAFYTAIQPGQLNSNK